MFGDDHAAAEELSRRLVEHGVESRFGGELLKTGEAETADREAVRLLLRHGLGLGIRGSQTTTKNTQNHECSQVRHRANPKPRRVFRASIRPNPNTGSRPALPRSVANLSSAASTAAGLVMPCCISMAATPVTCGVAMEVPSR